MESIYNKQAHFEYEILEKYEAGLVLTGQEVKSIRAGQMNLKGAYVTIKHKPKPELTLINAHVPAYKLAGRLPHYDPTRSRKLLMSRREINSLLGKIEQKGLTLLPLRVYTKHNLIKVEIGLGRGKKLYEKKELKKEKDVKREIRRTLKYQN